MASPRLWVECWTRLGASSFARRIADIPVINASGTIPVNGYTDGKMSIPKSFTRFDEILKPDVATPANAVSSLIRVMSESSATPIFEFIPSVFAGEQDKADPDVEISGPSIDAILGYARVEAWDWTGIDDEKSLFPDWIWGGRNILGELESAYDPSVIDIWTTADGGTFTLGVSVNGGAIQNTSAIAWNASAATVEAALEALSNVVDVSVTGTGSESSPWRVQTVDPEAEYSWSKNQAGLTGPWQVDVVGATGGTWTATIDGQTTAAIARNASAATVKTEIEALSTVTTCTVTRFGSGSEITWVVYFDNPDTVTTFTVTDSLTPVGATVTVTHLGPTLTFNIFSAGVVLPQGWTASFNPVTNLPHGFLNIFRITDFTGSDPAAPACDTSGFGIVFNGGASDFPGVQKIVPVKPGGRYYASVWVWANAAETYRFVIRDLYENGIAADPGFTTGTTVTPSTWTQFFIPIIDIPEDVDRVIFRFASVDSSAPNPTTFIACMELREGMPPTTWGDIWTQLWLDATTDHAPGRVVWEAGTTNLPYLTLDFDATLDSNGNAWLDSEVSITLKRGQSYLHVRQQDAKMGYEGRIVSDNVATGTYLFQLYNPGTLGTDLSLVSNGPSIQGGRDVSRRDLRRFLPPATDVAVEATLQNIARSTDSGAVAALGRIEQYVNQQDLGSLVEAAVVADTQISTNLQRAQSYNFVITPEQIDPEPFIAYKAGDTLFCLDPPDIPTREARRIKSLGFAMTKDRVEYPVQLESESYVGVGPAISSSVDFLMKEFKAIRAQPPEPTDILNYFTDPCCPSCPVQLSGYILRPVETGFYFVSWFHNSADPDGIAQVDFGGNLSFPAPGLYSYQINYQVRFECTADVIAQWRMMVLTHDSDGPIGDHQQTSLVNFSDDPTMFIEGNVTGWTHWNIGNAPFAISFGWSLLADQPTGVITGSSGSIDHCDLFVIRHSEGCAVFQTSDA